ncbi:hypothetical protein D621_10825 [beta proteobacterium AAP51]|nr:hypothetical protein D621_10825 [beta proteobacterium AAP51]
MELPLIISAALLGLAGAPHCAAMCSAPCAAATGPGPRNAALFHLARLGSYAAVGALVASSVAVLAGWSQLSPALRPLWVLLHVAALALGLWLLVRAQQPAWMARLGVVPRPVAAASWAPLQGPVPAAGPPLAAPAGPSRQRALVSRHRPQAFSQRALVAGSLWAVWPCGLLQSALLVAALGSSPATGALAMAAFALASAPGLVLGPWTWQRLMRGSGAAARERMAVRAGGGLLAAASVWALGHGVWQEVAAFCGLA